MASADKGKGDRHLHRGYAGFGYKTAFTISEELTDPKFTIYDISNRSSFSATVTQSDGVYNLTKTTAMEGNESKFYLLIQSDDVFAATRLDQLDGKTIDLSKARAVTIEEYGQAEFKSYDLYDLTCDDDYLNVSASFDKKKIRIYGVDESLGSVRFTVADRYLYCNKTLEHDQDRVVKLADCYRLFQYDTSGLEEEWVNGAYFPYTYENSDYTSTYYCTTRESDKTLSVIVSGYSLERFLDVKDPTLVIYTSSSVFVKKTSDYRKGDSLSDGSNRTVKITCDDESFIMVP